MSSENAQALLLEGSQRTLLEQKEAQLIWTTSLQHLSLGLFLRSKCLIHSLGLKATFPKVSTLEY